MTALTITRLPEPKVKRGRCGHCRLAQWIVPLVLFLTAGVMLLASIGQPYWRMKMLAPQYPKGLVVRAYLTHLEGDVQELNELNHYIGMLPLEKGGMTERSAAPEALIGVSAFLVLAAFVRTRWAVLLALPAVLFPVVFLLDLQGWLYYFGHHLDPHAALSSSIKPFTPKVLGLGLIGQFKTMAVEGSGFRLALYAAGVVVLGLAIQWFIRRRVARCAEGA